MSPLLLGLAGVQVFFLMSRMAGAEWGIFAPGGFGRMGSCFAAFGIFAAALIVITGAGWAAWGAVGVLFIWFVLLALDRDPGQVLLWRPVAGLTVACAITVRML